MIARLCSALKKLPAEVKTMTLTEARELFAYWAISPPENEMLVLLATVYTTWRPKQIGISKERTEQDIMIEHRRSLEDRWARGALNVRQMYEMGGPRVSTGHRGGANMGGIGLFPGSPEYAEEQKRLSEAA